MQPPSTPTERAAAALRRILAIAAGILRGLTLLAIAAAVAAGIAWLVWVADAPPGEADDWIGRILVLAVLLSPSAVLTFFLLGLRALRELPARYTSLPADVGAQASELRDRTRRRSEPRGVRGLLAALFRLARLAVDSRDVLSPYAVISIALRPAILLAALGATLAALLEVPLAAVAILVMMLA